MILQADLKVGNLREEVLPSLDSATHYVEVGGQSFGFNAQGNRLLSTLLREVA